jgi:hypothetical protein
MREKMRKKNSSTTIQITINDMHCSIRKIHSGASIKIVKRVFFDVQRCYTEGYECLLPVDECTTHALFFIIYIWVDTKLPLIWYNNNEKTIMKRQKKIETSFNFFTFKGILNVLLCFLFLFFLYLVKYLVSS